MCLLYSCSSVVRFLAEGRGLRQLFLWARSRPARGAWARPPATSHPGHPSSRQFPHPSATDVTGWWPPGGTVCSLHVPGWMQRTGPWWAEPQLPWASVSLPHVSSSPTLCAEMGGEGPLCESCFPGRSWGLFCVGSSPGTSDGSPLPPSRVQLGQGGRLTGQQSCVQIPSSPPRPQAPGPRGEEFCNPLLYLCPRTCQGQRSDYSWIPAPAPALLLLSPCPQAPSATATKVTGYHPTL